MNEEEYYTRIKAEYEASTDTKLVEWARPYFEGTKKPNSKDRYVICRVSDRAAQDILELTGSDVHGFDHVLRCDEVAHINKRHGKKGRADSSMRDISDLGRIAYVLNNYDEIIFGDRVSDAFRNKSGKHALSVMFVKRINGHVYAAEAITDSVKKKELYIETMYKARTSAYLAQKRESVVDDKNPRPNVRDASDSVTSILPQPETNVNSFPENDSGVQDRASAMSQNKSQNQSLKTHPMSNVERIVRECHVQKATDNGRKPPNGNGSGGSSGR